ncbi:probable transcription factor At1g61730 [Phalaenopsis equestris]|uniref:probable transcription factor At1g61730 n=1 Tax=Phalaenopsis equestris TaxID=78828 RepID=UPI0009E1EC53|nr:probable transcription factor At1g61730 [Phalaenopsis equestris]
MAKKAKEMKPPPSPSSSSEEDSPPPAISPVKNPAAGFTTAALQKQPEPSSKPIGGQEEEEEEEEGSESEGESTDDESSEDSGAVAAKANPPSQLRDSRTSDGKKGLNASPPSETDSEDIEEDGEEDVEGEDSSSESEQQSLPPPPQEAANAEGKKAAAPISGLDSSSEDESESSSDSDTTEPSPLGSARNTVDPSLKPLSSKPMDSPVQLSDKKPISRKRSTTSPTQVSKRKRKTADIIGAEGGQEKKEITRKIWSKADELALLQCILDNNELHHGTSIHVQAESLLKSVNNSLSSSVTLTQMNDKIRRLKQKYNATIKKVKDANKPNISNAQDAAAFDLSRKIWGPGKEELVFADNNFKLDKVKEGIMVEKGKKSNLIVEYPFLRWHAKTDHANNALVMQSHIPIVEAKALEGSCKKLEITEIQLHMQKAKLLSLSLKLIEDALEKC